VDATRALATFRGAQRRFQVKGKSHGVTVIDDYAHHPTEIRATLAAARQRYGSSRLWAVFQPHTYSRTAALFQEFATCFEEADHVIVMDVFKARASEMPILHASDLVAASRHGDIRYLADHQRIAEALTSELEPGDILLTLGAGDGYLIGEQVLKDLNEVEAS
jgi:UDP-N-acetylmuramate--alanine ligase